MKRYKSRNSDQGQKSSESKPSASSNVTKMDIYSIIISIATFMMQVQTIPVDPGLASEGAVNSTKAAINATIFDHAGHDITSSFQIRLYYPKAFAHNVANNSLSNRQARLSRSIDECPGLGEFMESFCNAEADQAGSLQRYTIICRDTFVVVDNVEVPVRNNPRLTYAAAVGDTSTSRQETHQRDGHCHKNEICVPGLGMEVSGKRMASCVPTEYFVKYINWGNNHRQEGFDLEGKIASMVVSQQDETTPMEVDTLAVDTKTNGVGQNRCRDCVELKTVPFEADTNNLRFQTKLLTVGTMAGVLWLAIASG